MPTQTRTNTPQCDNVVLCLICLTFDLLVKVSNFRPNCLWVHVCRSRPIRDRVNRPAALFFYLIFNLTGCTVVHLGCIVYPQLPFSSCDDLTTELTRYMLTVYFTDKTELWSTCCSSVRFGVFLFSTNPSCVPNRLWYPWCCYLRNKCLHSLLFRRSEPAGSVWYCVWSVVAYLKECKNSITIFRSND